MKQGKQRTRGAGCKKRASPSEIIANIESSSRRMPGRAKGSKHSPSCVLADALNTETQVFWNIWVEHHDYLRRQSLRWMSNNADNADDALSSAMLLAHRKFPIHAHAITNTRNWLTRLVHNVCMDHHRAANRLRGVESDLRYNTAEQFSFGDQRMHQPDQEVMSDELRNSLEENLGSLPVNLREPLILRCIHGMSYDDIAARMGLRGSAVRKRVQLARDRLRQQKEIS